MSLTLISTPEKTVNGILSNVVAGRSQVPFEFLTTDQANDHFKILIDILDEADVPYLTITFKYSPKPDGTLFLDFGRIVTEINEARGELATQFKIQYSSEWEGGTTAPVIIGPYLAVYGETQLLNEGGSNMWDYLINDTSSKFTTIFKNPVFWGGFVRLVSFVIDSNYQARTGRVNWRVRSTFYDINKVSFGSTFSSYNLDLTPRIILINMVNGGPFVGVDLENKSEELLFERRPLCDNPIMVDWLNSKGGVDQWLFEMDQLFERDAHEGLVSESAITEDISTVRKTKSRMAPKWTQQIICKAENLTDDQLRALEDIKSSISVRVWLDTTGANWIGVIASAKYKTMHNTSDKLHEFTLQLELPDNFDLMQGIDYGDLGFENLIDSDSEELIDLDNEILTG